MQACSTPAHNSRPHTIPPLLLNKAPTSCSGLLHTPSRVFMFWMTAGEITIANNEGKLSRIKVRTFPFARFKAQDVVISSPVRSGMNCFNSGIFSSDSSTIGMHSSGISEQKLSIVNASWLSPYSVNFLPHFTSSSLLPDPSAALLDTRRPKIANISGSVRGRPRLSSRSSVKSSAPFAPLLSCMLHISFRSSIAESGTYSPARGSRCNASINCVLHTPISHSILGWNSLSRSKRCSLIFSLQPLSSCKYGPSTSFPRRSNKVDKWSMEVA
mmetsp:Transcript_28240/g.45449  ORF Transcript_28240/g.45449 Transcript_28240/m.45449 type:complete len:271 (+) Transcript_28240:8183-8995(+)